jgi:hypothetical protein
MSRSELSQVEVSYALALAFAALRDDAADLKRADLPSEAQVDRMMAASIEGIDSPEMRAFVRRWLNPRRRALLEIQIGAEAVAEIYGE